MRNENNLKHKSSEKKFIELDTAAAAAAVDAAEGWQRVFIVELNGARG